MTKNLIRPDWDTYWARVNNETFLAARDLLELDTHRVLTRNAAHWLRFDDYAGWRDDDGNWHGEPEMDWEAWVQDVEERGRGWSSNEYRLFQVVAAFVAERPVQLVGVLDSLAEWRLPTLMIIARWVAQG